ncbi:MAG: superoxide dismutase [Bacteroidetes bacterium GWE2_41_25]|nr:MAG: superoxide dismutase [Bacteroidetes bacterium GWA2_40_15]OFX87902.1 MAG: superoxide dismutase [Bacteroidetes bacterium GWC2_40_22]OFY05432.1 MAG: superoxide dismutase [Bacteroidetes bacterium GWE2_41_25]OFY57028.1 MAG: superoxide dismutase [Bacteroidetes bacterium GWF2_41_9]HAM11257.1 superoxide dismutase [Bacteroidales bacterium]
MKQRNYLKTLMLASIALLSSVMVNAGNPEMSTAAGAEGVVPAEFPALPYGYDALEPYIDARTMEIHYDRHHRAYYTNFVNAIKGTAIEKATVKEIFGSISKQSDAVRNNGGGYYNHVFFWNNMGKGSTTPSKELSDAINKTFGSFDKFKETFSTSAKTRFGSGWAWLYVTSDKKLAVGSTANQDNPLMDVSPVKGTPLLALDVWEHAYYLKYQNKRADYVDAFWNVVNWDEVNRRYKEAVK